MIKLNMKKKYPAFTLIEILIVMGIIIVLMTVGISLGSLAIKRTQDVYHRDAAKELYSALLRYKGDNGSYPRLGGCSTCFEEEFFAYALGYKGDPEDYILLPYMEEEGVFDGGADATYYYMVDDYDAQFITVCVSFGGIDDETERGFFCTGDGLGALPESNPIGSVEIDSQESGDSEAPIVKGLDDSDWTKDSGFAASTN